VALAAACLLAAWPAARAAAPAPGSPERRMLDLVNAERSRKGLRRLTWNDDLARLARRHAEDMRRSGRVSHRSSGDGAEFEDRLAAHGFRARAAAENVAYDRNVERAHKGLMNSPGHRANILSPDLTAVGIGIVADAEGTSIYVAQNFATPIAELTDEEAAQRVRLAVDAARRSAGRGPSPEDRSLSRILEKTLDDLVKDDSVRVDAAVLPGPGWVVAYTTPEPSDLPAEARRRLGRSEPVRAYGVAAVFARTRSYPFGTYWVVLGTLEEQ
jgi:hypothetical protein